MHHTTNLLFTTQLLFIILSITSFSQVVHALALQPQLVHAHGGGCIPAERAALLSFHKGITSDNARVLASWHGQDCCRWKGVSCSNRTSHVIKLHLRNTIADPFYTIDGCSDANSLCGEISPSLLSLKHLEHMDLSMNCLLGPKSHIPRFLGSMKNLIYLDLSGIPFTGRVPSQLGNLSKLQHLDLGEGYSGMYSADITWLTKLPLLQYLSMSTINLSRIADWPHPLNMIPSLRVINLAECSLDTASQSLPYLNLTKLEKLDLSSNNLGHLIASSWSLGNMTSLQELDLSGNNLNRIGNLKSLLKNLCCLEILNLSDNFINGDIVVLMEGLLKCAWEELQELDFSMNKFTGTLPNFVGEFSSLSMLDLSSNNLVGLIPPGISNLARLTYLGLSDNQLNGSVPTKIGALTALTSLGMSNNNLTGTIPAELGKLKHLAVLILGDNEITGPIPPEIMHSTRLTYLDLSNNHLNGSVPTKLGLEELYLSSNQLSGSIPSLLTNITMLDISNNNFSVIPSNFEASRLQVLLIYSNGIGGYIPESLCKSKQLLYLDLSNNFLEGEIPQCFDIQKMQYLLLSNNSLSGNFPEFLQNNAAMEFLDLARNKLSGGLPTWIADLWNLRFVILSDNAFSDNIPDGITRLRNLQYLDLSGNNFSGAIPWHLSNLTPMKKEQMEVMGMMYDLPIGGEGGEVKAGANYFGQILSIVTKGQQLVYGRTIVYFVSIDLSSNSLTGEIPTDITSLAAVMNLNLSSNKLSGQIPNMIGAMKSLVSLDLSENMLSGEIPSSLSSLASLEALNLSYNNLSGRIPSGRQLDTLNSDNPSVMYIGNSGLCGPPLHKNCPGNDSSIIHGDLESSKQQFDPLTFHFGLVLGLVVGLWVVFCALLFKRTWRIAYFRLFDEVYDQVYVFVVVKWASFAKNTAAE